jgi:hypothetical protein
MDKSLTRSANLLEFFRHKVKEALSQQKVSVSDEVEYYLVHILTHFSVSENLYPRDSSGRLHDRALVLKLYDATFDSPKRFTHLKFLGDTALYRAGVFYDGLYNQAVDVDYYIAMGGTAYQSLANMTTSQEKTLADLYAQLSEQFPGLVEIMNLCCEKEVELSNHDLLKLLERYQKTGSQKAKEVLQERGISLDLLHTDKIM